MEFEWDPKKAASNLTKHGVLSAPDKRRARRKSNMKKDEAMPEDDDLRGEYDLSTLGQGVRGKYLERYRAGTNLALLAPDVRAAFPTNEAVNAALRALIQNHSA
jgi:hypothetical protein